MARTKISNNGNLIESLEGGRLDFKDNQATADFVTAHLQDRSHRDKLERQWYLNIAYFLGHQYLQWDPHSRKLYLPNAPRHRQRIVINRLLPIVRRITASTLRQKPQWTVSPATTETEDQITSQVATHYLKYQWRALAMDTKLIDLIKWRSTCGNAFIRAFWNPFKGDKIAVDAYEFSGKMPKDEEDKKVLRKEGKKKLEEAGYTFPEDTQAKLPLYLGDVDFEVVSPFHIFPDPNADTFEKAEWVLDIRERSRQYVLDRYNIKEEELSNEDDGSIDGLRKIRNLDSPIASMGAGSSSEQIDHDLIRVISLYVKPTIKEPNGWWAVIINDKVVRKARNDEGMPTFPYFHVSEIPVSGRLWGTCALEQAIPIQVAYNRARSQIIEHINTVSRPPWLIPKGSGIQDSAFTGEPGEKIKYTFPMKPELAKPVDFPQGNHQNVTQLVTDLEDVSSQHEAQRGVAPGRVESGVGLAALREQDGSIRAAAAQQTAFALGEAGSCLLKIASKMVDEERIVKVVGEGNLIDVKHFKGEDLVGKNSSRAGANYFDVIVEMGAAIPLTPAARRELAISLAQFNILDPTQKADREKILELLELKKDPTTLSPGQLDKANSRYEHAQMSQAEMVEIKSWDDDEIHISTHREFQKTPEYRKMIEKGGGTDSEIHQVFEMHIQAHADRLVSTMEGISPTGGQPPPMSPEGGIPENVAPPEAMAGMMQPPGGAPAAGIMAGLAGPPPRMGGAPMGPMGPPKTVPAPNAQQMDAFIRAMQQQGGGGLPPM